MVDYDAVYAELTDRLVGWARSRRDIRALAIVGSRAGPEKGADGWSDLDVLLVCRHPSRLHSGRWLSEIEEPWFTYPIKSPIGQEQARGAVFRDGQATIDFAFLGTHALRASSAVLWLFSRYPRTSRKLPVPFASALGILARMLQQGTNVVLDKDGALTGLAARQIRWPLRSPPTSDEFISSVYAFLGVSLWTAKKICRGDLWRCSVAASHDLKEFLLQMVEWHTQLLCGPDHDTLYLGRDLHSWADPRVVAALPRLFPHYNASELHASLVATIDLYGWVARDVADALDATYPETIHARVRESVAILEPESASSSSCEDAAQQGDEVGR
jgi:hypothetical protein